MVQVELGLAGKDRSSPSRYISWPSESSEMVETGRGNVSKMKKSLVKLFEQ